MGNEAAFERALRRQGSRFPIEKFDPELKTVGGQLLQISRALAPDISTGFLENEAFNAIATVFERRDFIGINLGAFTTLYRFFSSMLSDPNCLTEIGDASLERVDNDGISRLGSANIMSTPIRSPQDPIRALVAKDLAFCSHLILFFHELAHIELCHVAYVCERLGAAEYSELRALPDSKDEALLYRTLEWEADHSGALGSIPVWCDIYFGLGLTHLDQLGWSRSWLIAADMLFWIMDIIQPADRDWARATHPSPMTRLVCTRHVTSLFGNIPELSPAQQNHDSVVPWIVKNSLSARINDRRLPDLDAVTEEWNSFTRTYVSIAGRLEELQDQRSERTGRKIIRPEYPGRDWSSGEIAAVVTTLMANR